jgi:hypothetical protein
VRVPQAAKHAANASSDARVRTTVTYNARSALSVPLERRTA